MEYAVQIHFFFFNSEESGKSEHFCNLGGESEKRDTGRNCGGIQAFVALKVDDLSASIHQIQVN